MIQTFPSPLARRLQRTLPANSTRDPWMRRPGPPATAGSTCQACLPWSTTCCSTRGDIETPWLPGRAEACRWVAEQDWVYATSFAAPPTSGRRHLSCTFAASTPS